MGTLSPCLRGWPLLLAAMALHCAAQTPAAAVRADSLPTRVTLGIERVHLPAGEALGLVGGSLLVEVGDGWSVGPAVYGAATGRRGGLFVEGVELQRHWPLGHGVGLSAGIFAGGGGGAAAPVGSGPMLRPALTLLSDVGPRLQAGLSWSQLTLPSGDIRSRQFGLVLARRDDFRHDVGGRGTDPLAADGAVSGDAAGYMEILAASLFSMAPLPQMLPRWRVGARVGAELGGGVRVDGGALAQALLWAGWAPRGGIEWRAGIGKVRALRAGLDSALFELSWTRAFGASGS
ncbi:hypothetical protein [uncultured Piscinibacter sp.]|uniref:hypothetical protein n=1 Tax=uncultured Piscinibacter sp. TaxID=1131835 RepID=UPI00261A0C47|nr:hypothetical protein [uncultured Piscinibacter sp.]